jgi:hypothetical protein
LVVDQEEDERDRFDGLDQEETEGVEGSLFGLERRRIVRTAGGIGKVCEEVMFSADSESAHDQLRNTIVIRVEKTDCSMKDRRDIKSC